MTKTIKTDAIIAIIMTPRNGVYNACSSTTSDVLTNKIQTAIVIPINHVWSIWGTVWQTMREGCDE